MLPGVTAEFVKRCERLRITFADALETAPIKQQIQWYQMDPDDRDFTRNGKPITVGSWRTRDYRTPICLIHDE